MAIAKELLDGSDHFSVTELRCVIINGMPESRQDLLEILSTELNFPDYFGMNYDALLDVLCDMTWSNGKETLIIHVGVTDQVPDFFRRYLDTLSAAKHLLATQGNGDLLRSYLIP